MTDQFHPTLCFIFFCQLFVELRQLLGQFFDGDVGNGRMRCSAAVSPGLMHDAVGDGIRPGLSGGRSLCFHTQQFADRNVE